MHQVCLTALMKTVKNTENCSDVQAATLCEEIFQVYLHVLDKSFLQYPADVPVIAGIVPYFHHLCTVLQLTEGCWHRTNVYRIIYECVKSGSVRFLERGGHGQQPAMSSPFSWKHSVEIGTDLCVEMWWCAT